MKRWIVYGLIALAVIVLVSPGIVGRLAEENLRNSIRWAGYGNGDLLVTEEKFERGWFTAEGRHRIELTDGLFESGARALADGGDAARAPALIVDTRIDHGLVPVTSMARDAGSLQPALASTLSTLSLDLGSGRLVEVPGKVYSRIGLTGTTVSRLDLEVGSFHDEAIDVQWRGADVRVAIDAAASAMRYEGRIEPLQWTEADRASSLGVIEFGGDQRKTGYGFSTGEFELRMADASVKTRAGSTGGFSRLAFDARSELVDERVDGVSSLDIEKMLIAEFDEIDLYLDVALNGLDAEILQRIREALDEAREAGELDGALGGAYPRIESDLQALLQSGAELRVDRLELSLPPGDVTATMQFSLPETDPGPGFSWPALLLALKASADIRLPAALVEQVQEATPQAGALVAMGILTRKGDTYVVEAEYAQGLLTVNGAPMPIPLGTLSGSDRVTGAGPGH